MTALAGWVMFWLLSMRLAALQRRSRRQVRRGHACTIDRLIARGDWATLDSLTDGWSQS